MLCGGFGFSVNLRYWLLNRAGRNGPCFGRLGLSQWNSLCLLDYEVVDDGLHARDRGRIAGYVSAFVIAADIACQGHDAMVGLYFDVPTRNSAITLQFAMDLGRDLSIASDRGLVTSCKTE